MFFEDFEIGQRFTTDTRSLTEDEIIGFAREWDKQPFHLDPQLAQRSIYGGLIASGFHTLLISFDLVLSRGVWAESSSGSPGMENVRWLLPVRPGDALQVDFEVASVRPSRSHGDRGYVTWDHATLNQSGEEVMRFRSVLIHRRRNALADPV